MSKFAMSVSHFDGVCGTAATPERALLVFATGGAFHHGGFWKRVTVNEEACDLSILNSGRAPLLIDHYQQVDSQVGVIERAWIDHDGDAGGVVCALAKFSRRPVARALFDDIVDGITKNVSVGFDVLDGEQDPDGVLNIQKWRPYEVSIVAVPANWRATVKRAPLPLDEVLKLLASLKEADAAAALQRVRRAANADAWERWAADAAATIAADTGADPERVQASLRRSVDTHLDTLVGGTP